MNASRSGKLISEQTCPLTCFPTAKHSLVLSRIRPNILVQLEYHVTIPNSATAIDRFNPTTLLVLNLLPALDFL